MYFEALKFPSHFRRGDESWAGTAVKPRGCLVLSNPELRSTGDGRVREIERERRVEKSKSTNTITERPTNTGKPKQHTIAETSKVLLFGSTLRVGQHQFIPALIKEVYPHQKHTSACPHYLYLFNSKALTSDMIPPVHKSLNVFK